MRQADPKRARAIALHVLVVAHRLQYYRVLQRLQLNREAKDLKTKNLKLVNSERQKQIQFLTFTIRWDHIYSLRLENKCK